MPDTAIDCYVLGIRLVGSVFSIFIFPYQAPGSIAHPDRRPFQVLITIPVVLDCGLYLLDGRAIAGYGHQSRAPSIQEHTIVDIREYLGHILHNRREIAMLPR